MGHIEIEFWEILLHVSVIILLCITILYLLKGKANRSRSMLKIHTKGHFREFNQEIISQLIRLQADRALETISSTAERELRVLNELINNGNIAIEDRNPFPEKQNQSPMQLYKEVVEDQDSGASSIGSISLEKVERRSDLGVHTEELNGTERMSESEILLMEKLNKYAHESDGVVKTLGAMA